MQLTERQSRQMYGKANANNILIYFFLGCIAVGLIKMIFSKRGRVSFAGIILQWGK